VSVCPEAAEARPELLPPMVAFSFPRFPNSAHASCVLVVTSNDGPLAPLLQLLRDAGHLCPIVTDLSAAIGSLERLHPSLILLDVSGSRPGADHFSRFRNHAVGRETPVILLTTHGAALHRTNPPTHGPVDTITKPFHAGDVLIRIDAQLRIAALQSQLGQLRARCAALEKELAATSNHAVPPATGTPMIAFPGAPLTEDHRPLRQLGLSSREAEVLYWMSHGKTVREIATIIGAAYGTARKHAEHIYAKLGVEGHRGAMLRALEILQAV